MMEQRRLLIISLAIAILVGSVSSFSSSLPRKAHGIVSTQQQGQESYRRHQSTFSQINQLPRVAGANASTPLLAYVDRPDKPTFRRLFTHDTWKLHLGGSVRERWLKCLSTLPDSVILQSVAKMTMSLTVYAALISCSFGAIGGGGAASAGSSPAALRRPGMTMIQQAVLRAARSASGAHQLALTFCGTAIGLLLVFRTNNAYRRLEEARTIWGSLTAISQEIVAKCLCYLPIEGTCQVCRYLAAYMWALRDELKDGERRCDILAILLSKQDKAIISQNHRSRPLAIHGLLRRYLHKMLIIGGDNQQKAQQHEHFLLEMDLSKLAALSSDCERLFTSPIPPTMSRHGLRSLTLFLAALPAVLAASGMTPLANAFWTFGISFIYLGIDELGVQVEQPFQIIPLWQICQMLQQDMEELAIQASGVATLSKTNGSSIPR